MSRDAPRVILAIDPGRDKCGLALLGPDCVPEKLAVVPRQDLARVVLGIVRERRPAAILVGDRTTGRAVAGEIEALEPGCPVRLVPEHNTTLRARERYFQDNPPTGWRRLVPRGLLLPPRPVDDYAALLMAEDYVAAKEREGSSDGEKGRG